MEEVVESFGRVIFRILKWFIVEAVIEIVIYWYGRITLKILSFGQYPKSSDQAEGRCVVVGIISIILTIGAIASFS